MSESNLDDMRGEKLAWYAGIDRYQWLVLTVCSLGWIFDIFEGQIFVASMREAIPSLTDDPGQVDVLNRWAMASFLVGGALGGVVFGWLADRIGRSKTLALTIVVYSLFTFITAFAQAPWQFILLRFVVALGTGGEWAVGAAFVAEVFPKRSRPWMGSIFHGSSVVGTFLAVFAGAYVIGNQDLGEWAWRWGFALGALPAILVLWIRWSMKEPERWVEAHAQELESEEHEAPRLLALFMGPMLRRTLFGLALSTTGIATFWGVHIFGKSVTLHRAEQQYLVEAGVPVDSTGENRKNALEPYQQSIKNAEMLGMFVTTLGGGLGLLSFGAISNWLGRRGAFVFYYLGGFVATLVVFLWVYHSGNLPLILVTLPVFGFLTLGMHAGYAVYFPELYPTRLRSSGSGFCFNVGRFTAAPILLITALFQGPINDGGWGMSNEEVATWMSVLFLVGAVISLFGPETRGQELPD